MPRLMGLVGEVAEGRTPASDEPDEEKLD